MEKRPVVGTVTELGRQNFGGAMVSPPERGGILANAMDSTGALRKVEALEARVAQLEREIADLRGMIHRAARGEELGL